MKVKDLIKLMPDHTDVRLYRTSCYCLYTDECTEHSCYESSWCKNSALIKDELRMYQGRVDGCPIKFADHRVLGIRINTINDRERGNSKKGKLTVLDINVDN